MAVIAVAAPIFASGHLRHRAARFRELSAMYQSRAAAERRHFARSVAAMDAFAQGVLRTREVLFQVQDDGFWTRVWQSEQQTLREHEAHAQSVKTLANHLDEQAEKYDRGARRPWESIAPDPPEPKLTAEPLFERLTP